MKYYEKITTKDHAGHRQTLNVRILSEGGGWLLAEKVDNEGNDTESHYNADGVLVVVNRLIDVGAITKRTKLRWNLHYGTLETDQ